MLGPGSPAAVLARVAQEVARGCPEVLAEAWREELGRRGAQVRSPGAWLRSMLRGRAQPPGAAYDAAKVALRGRTAPRLPVPGFGRREVACRARGIYSVGPAELSATDPFGLAERTAAAGEPGRLVVFPRIESPTPTEAGRRGFNGRTSKLRMRSKTCRRKWIPIQNHPKNQVVGCFEAPSKWESEP